jgi:hypothetical protein
MSHGATLLSFRSVSAKSPMPAERQFEKVSSMLPLSPLRAWV